MNSTCIRILSKKIILFFVACLFVALSATNARSADGWVELTKIEPSDAADNKNFGNAVDISGDYMIVGNVNDESAYIFKWNAGSWTEVKKLVLTPVANDDFGFSVSISGDYAVVGATRAQKAYVFYRGAGDTWDRVAVLSPSVYSINHRFGKSVSISGDYILVGDYLHDHGGAVTNGGAAYLFIKPGGGWGDRNEDKIITASDGADANDYFGVAVSIDGSNAIVGAFADDEAGADKGAVYIINKDQGGVGNWGTVKKVLLPNLTYNSFGDTVSISGNYAIVGAGGSGAAFILYKDQGGADNWGNQATLVPSSNDEYGYAVDISGDRAIVSDLSYTEGPFDSIGAIYIYERSGTTWPEVAKMHYSSGVSYDQEGEAVAISNRFAAYTSVFHPNLSAQGAVFPVFRNFTATSSTPYANDNSAQAGLANPVNILDSTPAFSFICNDSDGDSASKLRIQVATDSDFNYVIWDSGSGGNSIAVCANGNRSQDIIYGGLGDSPVSKYDTLINDGTGYFWRVKLWDLFEGDWSSAYSFAMNRQDADGDGVYDPIDNCQTLLNRDQTDSEGIAKSDFISYWKFDESGGIDMSDELDHNPGSAINGPLSMPGILGNGLVFDGSSSYVEVNSSSGLDVKAAITLAAFVKSNSEGYVIVKDPPLTTFSDDFETNKGWALGGEFQRSNPLGLGATQHNYPDPNVAVSGINVLGTDLRNNGDYENGQSAADLYAISPTIDCTYLSNATLKFQRWLNVEGLGFDTAYIHISNDDGATWHEVWSNAAAINDNAWSLQSYDISAYADGHDKIKIKFSLSSDGTDVYSGWNIDDVEITGDFTDKANVPYSLSTVNGGEFLIVKNNVEYKVNSTTNINDGQWHFIVATYDKNVGGGEMKIYVDGLLEATNTAFSGDLPVNHYSVWIGRHYHPNVSTGYFDGMIDEVAVMNRAISAAEVSMIYSNILSGYSYFGDGIGDICDNCRFVRNENQLDSDGNCSAFPFLSDPLCGDVCQASVGELAVILSGPRTAPFGSSFTLSGEATGGGGNYTYELEQTTGSQCVLMSQADLLNNGGICSVTLTSPSATFTAPSVTDALTFVLRVSDGINEVISSPLRVSIYDSDIMASELRFFPQNVIDITESGQPITISEEPDGSYKATVGWCNARYNVSCLSSDNVHFAEQDGHLLVCEPDFSDQSGIDLGRISSVAVDGTNKCVENSKQVECSLVGAESSARLGEQVVTADVNGDQMIEALISEASGNGKIGLYGQECSSLYEISSSAGASLSNMSMDAGDINGDGVSDIIIFKDIYSEKQNAVSGVSEYCGYIILGGEMAGDMSLPSSSDATICVDYPVSDVAIGDFNCDGAKDIAVASVDANAVYIFSGRGSLADIAGKNIVMENAEYVVLAPVNGIEFGFKLVTTELTGDSCADLFIGSPLAEQTRGAVYIVFGQPYIQEELDINISVRGVYVGSYLGRSMSVGDLTCDGINDVALKDSYTGQMILIDPAQLFPAGQPLTQNVLMFQGRGCQLVKDAKPSGGATMLIFIIAILPLFAGILRNFCRFSSVKSRNRK